MIKNEVLVSPGCQAALSDPFSHMGDTTNGHLGEGYIHHIYSSELQHGAEDLTSFSSLTCCEFSFSVCILLPWQLFK